MEWFYYLLLIIAFIFLVYSWKRAFRATIRLRERREREKEKKKGKSKEEKNET